MKEPLVNLEFTEEDRLHLLSCLCSGSVYRRVMNGHKHVVVFIDFFSFPINYGIDSFRKWNRQSKNPVNITRGFLLARKFRNLFDDLEHWVKHIVEVEMAYLPKFIEDSKEAAETAAIHCFKGNDVVPYSEHVLGIRDQCLRRGLRHRLGVIKAEASQREHSSELEKSLAAPSQAESSKNQKARNPLPKKTGKPANTYDPNTGAHKVPVDANTVARMETLFKQVKEKE